MSRRHKDSDEFLDGLMDFLIQVPWWVGPPLILLVWVFFGVMAPSFLQMMGEGENDQTMGLFVKAMAPVLVMLSPLFAGVVALVWVVALLKKLDNGWRLERQTDVASIRKLSWQEFELLLAEIFRRQGYRVRETAAGADGGIDLVLWKAGQETVVQAKHWQKWKVGVRIVRELLGVQVSRGAAGAILVTSGHFTEEAGRFAAANGIQLIDGRTLQPMLREAQRSQRFQQQSVKEDTTTVSIQSTAMPRCPVCAAVMVQRIARRGPNVGQSFWGCSSYPDCRGTRPKG